MSADTTPSRRKDIPHSGNGSLLALIGVDVIMAGNFNMGETTSISSNNQGKKVDVMEGFATDDSPNIIVGRERTRRGAVIYYKWYVGKIDGSEYRTLSEAERTVFDGKVRDIISGEEVYFGDLRSRILSLIPRRAEIMGIEDKH